jgi:hypothetical protein
VRSAGRGIYIAVRDPVGDELFPEFLQAFGAFKSIFHNNLSAEGAILYQPGAQPQEKWAIENRGLKARSIRSFETTSGDPSAHEVRAFRVLE